MKCPICKSSLTVDDYHDGAILLESETKCVTCGRYSEQYTYGNTEAGILLDTNWRVWQWSYNTNIAIRGRINSEMGQATVIARLEYERE